MMLSLGVLNVGTWLDSNGTIALIGLAGTALGGIGVEILRRREARSEKKMDDAAKIRQELWDELAVVRSEVKDLRDELDEWKEKYFKLYAENMELLRENLAYRERTKELEAQKAALEAENARLQEQITALLGGR